MYGPGFRAWRRIRWRFYESRRLLGTAQLRVREAERADAGVDQRLEFGGPAADRAVLHQHDPAALADVA